MKRTDRLQSRPFFSHQLVLLNTSTSDNNLSHTSRRQLFAICFAFILCINCASCLSPPPPPQTKFLSQLSCILFGCNNNCRVWIPGRNTPNTSVFHSISIYALIFSTEPLKVPFCIVCISCCTQKSGM